MPTPGVPGAPSSLSAMARTGWMVETGNIMGRNIASRGRSARGPVADFNLLFASRRAPKQEPPASEEASGLGVSAQAGREGKGARARSEERRVGEGCGGTCRYRGGPDQ